MDGFGYLLDVVLYFMVTIAIVAPVVWHVDAKTAVPWASPWRTRLPKLLVVGGPPVFILTCAISLTGIPGWAAWALVIGSLAAPWAGALLISVEWLRRRAEDRATGLVRPERPWI